MSKYVTKASGIATARELLKSYPSKRASNDDVVKRLQNSWQSLKEHFIIDGHGDLWELIDKNCYFAGGCIRSLKNNEEPRDYDIFFVSDHSKQSFINYIKEHKLENSFKVFKPEVNTFTLFVGRTQYQFVTILHGMPDKVVKQFDFTMNSNYYYPHLDIIDINPDVWDKFLHPNKEVYMPFSAMSRVVSFIKRGFYIKNNDLVKLAYYCQKQPIHNIKDLKKYATGISKNESTEFEDVIEDLL